ncbi:MAG: hypothetical protein PHC50_07845 [Candidatus Cloacimonetes bacterium]|nr:hypothetical protein [Candidatus Cloacimonadota bacterium]
MKAKLIFCLVLLTVLMVACDLKRDNPLDPQSHLDVVVPGTVSGLQLIPMGTGTEARAVFISWNNNNIFDTNGYYVYRGLSFYSSYAIIDTVYHAMNADNQSYTHSSENDPTVQTGDYWYRISAFKDYPSGRLEGRPCTPVHVRVK